MSLQVSVQDVSVQEALIYAMVTMSAIDGIISERESRKIRSLVTQLPVFAGFDPAQVPAVAQACGKMLEEEAGIANIIDLVAACVPPRLHETAYALAVDIAVVDADIDDDEVAFLGLLSAKLKLDKLVIAALEHAAFVRHME
jgi:tellurite resistance protein